MDETRKREEAIERRDAATRGVRRLTLVTAAAATAAAGAIAGVTATSGGQASTPVRELLGAGTRGGSAVPAVPEPTPTVSSVDTSAPSAPQSAPSSAGSAPPVVVSGGS